MTKILGGVPTRKRATGGRVADWLAEVCDEVLVVSQGAIVNARSSKVRVVERDTDIGMKAARNEIFQYGMDNGYDFIVQSDDDLVFRIDVPYFLIDQIQKYPWIGSISSCPRVYYNWEKDVISSHPFLVFQCPTQLWAVRTEAIRQSGMLDIDVLEDIELGLRMWKCGWVLTKVHAEKELVHNPVVSRIGKGDDSGGQPESLRKSKMPESVEFIWGRHRDILSIFEVSTNPRRTYNARYNWNAMLRFPRERWGILGYQDSKGRNL